MTIEEVIPLLVDDLNKFVFVVVLRAYRLFFSYFLYKCILNWLFALHIVTQVCVPTLTIKVHLLLKLKTTNVN